MINLINAKIAYVVIVILVTLPFLTSKSQAKQEKISAFGKYKGYSEAIYNGGKRVSDYLIFPNGTRLAYDLFLPAKNGVSADRPLPVLFKYTPYGRAWTIYDENGKNRLSQIVDFPWYYKPILRVRSWFQGKVMDALSRTEWLREMVNSGYAVIVVDRPGTGASFGTFSLSPEAGARETDEILNWVAAQKWCDGNIGMFGDSIQAQIQFQAASTGNPYLKAIMPATTWMDNYSAVVFPGGVLNKAMTNFYARANKAFDSLATPVDSDQGWDAVGPGACRAPQQAWRSKKGSRSVSTAFPFRDSLLPNGENLWIDHQTLYPLLNRVNRSGIPVYQVNGWYDIYARDNFMIYANLTVPRRLLVRPTDHSGIEAPGPDLDYAAEAHRWFDYWLKGIDNGIMAEPPIHYYLQGTDKKEAWQSTEVWPPKNREMTRYYCGPGETASGNHGTLEHLPPAAIETSDPYAVDYSTTTGRKPHWAALASSHEYPDMRANDAKALTYTTPPLSEAVQIVGHPLVHLWLSSDARDLDLFVYLEEVDENGDSKYITQGNLRASHRALSPCSFNNLDLPWRNHFQSEIMPIPAGEPVEMVFDLLPTAYRFSKGKSVRLTIAFADAGNFDTPVLNPAPRIRLWRDRNRPSCIDLPIIPSR